MNQEAELTPRWVEPGKLAGIRKPEAHELGALAKARFQAVISLCDDQDNHQLYQDWKLPFLWLPVASGQIPSRVQLEQMVNFIEQFEGAVAVHCSGGQRTAAGLAAYLIHQQGDFDLALGTIEQIIPELELDEAQLMSLLQQARVIQ
ncbi:protein phosphatase [Ferrimonas sediminicola]|uniref:Protein phosphatase n=1 Tax=Ferrimonas sediminicola TaxID=2569538 RepID=A0A4U1BG05_9GAMM|nr:dual specificity protein phosphatase family protein [Ferrimonas sediminicola]TKB50248.1 protein phosphatase [Ferrimonas sediminicola]